MDGALQSGLALPGEKMSECKQALLPSYLVSFPWFIKFRVPACPGFALGKMSVPRIFGSEREDAGDHPTRYNF